MKLLENIFTAPARFLRWFLAYRAGQKTLQKGDLKFTVTKEDSLSTMALIGTLHMHFRNAKTEKEVIHILGAMLSAVMDNNKGTPVPSSTPTMSPVEQFTVIVLATEFFSDVLYRQKFSIMEWRARMELRFARMVSCMPKHVQETFKKHL